MLVSSEILEILADQMEKLSSDILNLKVQNFKFCV